MYVASLVFAAIVGQSNPSDASRANLDRIFKDYKASVVVVTDNRTSQWRYMPGPIEKVLGPVLYGENQKITPFTAGILVQPNPTLPVEVASWALIAGLRGLTSDQRKKLNRGGIFAGDLSESPCSPVGEEPPNSSCTPGGRGRGPLRNLGRTHACPQGTPHPSYRPPRGAAWAPPGSQQRQLQRVRRADSWS